MEKVNSSSDAERASSSEKGAKKSNKGCWMLAVLGCGVVMIILGSIIALFVFVLAAGSGWGGSVSESVVYEGTGGKIAVVSINGVISEGSSSGGLLYVDGAAAETVNTELSKAMTDESVDGVILKMNSPGGEVVASDLIYQKVLEVSEVKPVVTWMSGMGASGAYLIASGSDRIYAHPATITGSIGVVMELTDLAGLYEKLGIESRIFKSGEFKDTSGVFDEDPEGEADAIMQGLVDESYEDFVSAVAQSRGMEEAVVRKLADGRVYSGTQASENGLIDSVGDMDDAVAAVEDLVGKSDLSIVEYSTGGFWDSFYEYERALVDKIGFFPAGETVGVTQYYLLDM